MTKRYSLIASILFLLSFSTRAQPGYDCVMPLESTFKNYGKINNVYAAKEITIVVQARDGQATYFPTIQLEEIEGKLRNLAIKEQLDQKRTGQLDQREEKLNYREEAITKSGEAIEEKIQAYDQKLERYVKIFAEFKELFSNAPASKEAQSLLDEAEIVLSGASCLSKDYKADIKTFKNDKGEQLLGFPIDKFKNDPNFIFRGKTADGLTSIKRFNKIGFVDETGKEVIPCQFDEVFNFRNGLCLARIAKSYLVIDKSGQILNKVVNPPAEAEHLNDNLYLFRYQPVTKGGQKKEAIFLLEQEYKLSEQFDSLQLLFSTAIYYATQNNAIEAGKIDLKTLTKKPFASDFKYISKFNKYGYAACSFPGMGTHGDSFGIVNSYRGEVEITPYNSYSHIGPPSPDWGFFIATKGQTSVLLDNEGKIYFNQVQPDACHTKSVSIAIHREHFKHSAPLYSIVVYPRDSDIATRSNLDEPSKQTNAYIQLPGAFYVLLDLSSTHQPYCQEKLIDFGEVDANNLLPVRLYENKEWNLFSIDTKTMIADETFTAIRNIGGGFYAVTKSKKKDKWAVLSKQGFRITDYKYHSIDQFQYDLSIVNLLHPTTNAVQYGVINNVGAEVVPPIFEKIEIEDTRYHYTSDKDKTYRDTLILIDQGAEKFEIRYNGNCFNNCKKYKALLADYYQR